MNDMTLRIIEGLVMYDLFKIFVNLTLRLALNALPGGDKDGDK